MFFWCVCIVHDTARDKMYLDIRQIFSIWFVPMYSAHVRLVTVLDLVSNEDPDYHDPLDRILKQQQEDASDADEKSSTLHQHHTSTSTTVIAHHDSRTWKIHKQEDLYQVNEFLKFTGTNLLAYAWILFQIGASIVCVFMALLVRLSPWAFQKEPARGGAEATIRQIDDDDDDDDDGAAQHEAGDNDDDGGSKAGGKSVAGEDSHSTNGNRRGSANSKASPSTQKKPWKNGGKKNGL